MGKLHGQIAAGDHSKGEASAKVTLVEYGDYQCPDCGVAYRELKRVFAHYDLGGGKSGEGNSGDGLRFVYRNFPLEMHPMAEPAAELAEYAATKGKFWEVHDAIFQHQSRMSETTLTDLAKKEGLSAEEAGEAIEEQSFSEKIEGDVKSGKASGVHGTPTFFINGTEFEGDYSAENLIAAIDEASA